jgi:hypothetical protein
MSGLEDLQRSFVRVCWDDEPSSTDLAALHGDRSRWLLYRSMVRGRLFETVRSGLPRSAEILGDRLDRMVATYLASSAPHTRFLREVVTELVAYALPQWSADPTLPSHFVDLVRYEETKWKVSALPWPALEARELDFERPAVVNPTARVIIVSHRVDRDPTSPPRLDAAEYLLVFRKPDDTLIHTWGLNEIGGRLFTAWCEDRSCADGVRAVLAELGRSPDAAFIDGMAGVLADLVEQRVVLGSR